MNFIANVSTIIDNEKKFNTLCYRMAKNNISSAYGYIGDIFTKSISNKDKLIHLTKAYLLVLRTPLLYLPFINRVTQLFLRLFSSKLTKDFVNSSNFFQVEEIRIRYSEDSLVNACIVCQTNPENQPQDIVKFIRKIKTALVDEEGKRKLREAQYKHALPR